MATAAKKTLEDPAKNSDQYWLNGRWAENIEQMSDLGKGYMLVKFKTKRSDTLTSRLGRLANPEMAVAPTIPSEIRQFTPQQVRQLLQEFSEQLAATPTVGMVHAPLSASKARRVLNENDEFMDNLRAQEMVSRRRDIDKGQLITSGELAERLQMTTQALRKAVQHRRMFTLIIASGRHMYPAFFADLRCNREHIEHICQALGDWPSASKWEFFTSPRMSLNGLTPIEALARGEIDQVLRAATAFKEL